MSTKIWGAGSNGGADSDWNNPANWTGDTLPTVGDDVIIDGSVIYGGPNNNPSSTDILNSITLDGVYLGQLIAADMTYYTNTLNMINNAVISPSSNGFTISNINFYSCGRVNVDSSSLIGGLMTMDASGDTLKLNIDLNGSSFNDMVINISNCGNDGSGFFGNGKILYCNSQNSSAYKPFEMNITNSMAFTLKSGNNLEIYCDTPNSKVNIKGSSLFGGYYTNAFTFAKRDDSPYIIPLSCPDIYFYDTSIDVGVAPLGKYYYDKSCQSGNYLFTAFHYPVSGPPENGYFFFNGFDYTKLRNSNKSSF